MKYITFFLFFSLFTLHACSLNTKFDDDEYRPVGASTPVNSKTHTVSEAKKVYEEIKPDSELDSNSTRYVRPNSLAKVDEKEVKRKVIVTKQSQDAVFINGSNTHSATKKSNNLIDSINDVFSSGYGDSDIIIKIAKTVQIHCDQTSDKASRNSEMEICDYQFPKHCGAHRFSLINSKKKQLLMFHDINYQRNVIDTLSGNTNSIAGLWDKDDYVSSDLLTVKQLISNKISDTNDLGWIMSVSDNEKSQLGRSYLTATREASKCF